MINLIASKDQPYSHLLRLLAVMQFVFLLSLSTVAMSKTYKFQDSNGQWHYTDKPPLGSLKTQEIQPNKANNTRRAEHDLTKRLDKKFHSSQPEKTATLAVVEIKSAFGLGAGFFYTENGYIVTNKHVVKPTDSTLWNKHGKNIALQEKRLLIAQSSLDSRSAYHEKLYQSLVEFENATKRHWDRDTRRILQARHKILLNNFEESERQLNIIRSNYNAVEQNIKKLKSDLSLKSSASYWAHKYKIKLKDGTRLNAKFVGSSKDYDLAFLKLQGYKTPFLIAADQAKNIQGSTVYAIGSPLGVSDSLTSGTVTNVQSDYIYTNTSVFPGNSGGPLINQSGNVLGVITQKITQGNVMSQGFGIAIPISLVDHELSKFTAKNR